MDLDTQPASDLPTADLLRLTNLSFEEYTVPIHFEMASFLNMLRKDTVDLASSRVLLVDGQPGGIALIARRGWTSRLAAMGITREQRGKRAGDWLMGELLREAQERGDREMNLEVIEQNERAVRLYQKHGFQTVRRLVSLSHPGLDAESSVSLKEIDLREMGRLILRYGLPELPWQISGESIALLTPPARAYQSDGAYIAISNPDAEQVIVWSLLMEKGADDMGGAASLLREVMEHHPRRKWYVPAVFPEEMSFIFEQAGFQRESLSQWQMRRALG